MSSPMITTSKIAVPLRSIILRSSVRSAPATTFMPFGQSVNMGPPSGGPSACTSRDKPTFGESTVFTGVRFENRFRPLKREHFLNPVLYVEYERKNGADKIMKEIEGHDTESDFLAPNAQARREHINS